MGEHTVIVEISVKEFDDGAEVNSTTARMLGDQEYVPLVMRLMSAFVDPYSGAGR